MIVMIYRQLLFIAVALCDNPNYYYNYYILFLLFLLLLLLLLLLQILL